MSLPWVFALLFVAMLVWHGGRFGLHPKRRLAMGQFINRHPKVMAVLLLIPVLFLLFLSATALIIIIQSL